MVESRMADRLFMEAMRLARAGENMRAFDMFGRILSLDPSHNMAAYNRGVILLRMGRLKESAEVFLNLFSRIPDDPDIFINLGKIMDMSGKPDQAMDFFRKALEHDPGNPEANCMVGVLLGRSHGKYEEAVEYFDKALKTAADMPEARQGLAICYHHLGDTDKAMINIRAAIRMDPENGVLHNHLGIMYMKMGEEERADKHFRRALELNPGLKLRHQNLWDMKSSLHG
ncbi:MAG TPA: tetratricopeptide repeat protein [bacterium]|nr:tetratricopeptide repeat protein [bacterium]